MNEFSTMVILHMDEFTMNNANNGHNECQFVYSFILCRQLSEGLSAKRDVICALVMTPITEKPLIW